ncbi:Alpha-ketoglutarate-dependent dioxygenase AlkB-like [Parasponia andersonii]|uniref:Alpha-ketoglutarate-dependent dioxygenase AlkB-like n=1 Tax=Parasponia andersonii TaxID=3476 RepID=A0A2P5CXC1_PARAD|nr:Alpha-ketoglutarate-dependent dioxygenase AlkB-like [Parasponia andersonii]
MDSDKALLIQVFGESSGSEQSEEEEEEEEEESSKIEYRSQPKGCCCCWERFEEIKGLWLCTDFLSLQHQSSLLSAVQNEGWFSEASHNQAMRFGQLPSWAMELSDSIRDVVVSSSYNVHDDDMELGISYNGRNGASPFPSDLLWREPLFDQLIVNLYHPGEGICAHVDLMRFEDGIAIVSLESPCVMHFSQVEETTGESTANTKKIPVYLTPGSLILMSGEARYMWNHEINRKPGFQQWKGQELQQSRRISITLRKLRQEE